MLGVAYRMLGSRAEAEDMVQEAWLRWSSADRGEVRSTRAWLTTVVTRLCLDALKSAKARREVYVGSWLPEPWLGSIPSPDDGASPATFTLAFVALLESLSPLERAVYVLHEAFDMPHAEIGLILARDEAACRKLLERARVQLRGPKLRLPIEANAQRRLIERFLAAASTGDLSALTALLAADVRVTSDGGGKVKSALQTVVGQDKAARLFEGLARKFAGAATATVEWTLVNGSLGVLLKQGDALTWILHFVCEGDQIVSVELIGNPEKFPSSVSQLD
jgi:RNA polymerase sigma-70 factor, ECF subfamily